MSRRLLSAAAATALLLGLAACDDGKEGPATTAPPSIDIGAPSDGGGGMEPSDGGGTETETAEPSASAPDIPAPDPADFAGMDEHTPEGAEQAFRYYIAVSMWAHQTGDEKSLKSLQADDCAGCKYLNDDIPEARSSDLLWSEAAISNSQTSINPSETYEQEIRYAFTLNSHSRPDKNFEKYIHLESLDYDSVGGMDWVSNQWIVVDMSVEWGTDVH